MEISMSHGGQLQNLSQALPGQHVQASTKLSRVAMFSSNRSKSGIRFPPRSQAVAGGEISTDVVKSLEKEINVGEVARLLKRFQSEKLPERFFVKNWELEGTFVPHDQFTDLPVIDLSMLESDPERIAKEFGDAAAEYGFMQVINHDVPLELIKEHEALGHEFMALPVEIKNKGHLGRFIGYNGGVSHEELGTAQQAWVEAFGANFSPHFTLEMVVDAIWPEGNPKFMEVWNEYAAALRILNHTIHELCAVSLGLSKDAYTRHISENESLLSVRWSHYPPNPTPEQTLGLSGHMDPNGLTILHQDAIGGLQIKHKGEWLNVRPIPGAFIINVGDIMQAWTNDRYKSVEHRVVTNSKDARLSIGTFTAPDYRSCEISAPEELVDKDHPRKYKPFTPCEYLEKMGTTNEFVVDRSKLKKFLI